MEAEAPQRSGRGLHHTQLSLPRRAARDPLPRMSAVKSRYELFDRGQLLVKPLAERIHDLRIERWLALDDAVPEYSHPQLSEVARRIVAAGHSGAARILMMGAHVLRAGENIGRRIAGSDYPYKDLSVFAAAYRLSIPVTVHVGIGYDILHEHPNCDGAAVGAASYRDFLIFARTVQKLEGGVMLSFGSAIMAPEVYLKALAMARNVACQSGRQIRNFSTAVFDLVPIEGDIHRELAKTDPGYYFRPHKTILVRTVADGGESFYFCGDHRATLPALRLAIIGSGDES